jgi:5-methylcytosine-specific restriction endonuclease McrA
VPLLEVRRLACTMDDKWASLLYHQLLIREQVKQMADRSKRPLYFCTKCNKETPFNTHNRCMVCQDNRSKEYRERLKASGGPFSRETKKRRLAEHPEFCPAGCDRRWENVPVHLGHPNTKWHFDHIVSPQNGGTNAFENCAIMCWECNLKKGNKSGVTQAS